MAGPKRTESEIQELAEDKRPDSEFKSIEDSLRPFENEFIVRSSSSSNSSTKEVKVDDSQKTN